MVETIGICLATYNGASFLHDQLTSIAAQSFSDWHLYARDDGSTDDTVEILSQFVARFPDQVTLLLDSQGRLGPRRNFQLVTSSVRAPYIAFSDQDDIWRPHKLAQAHDRIQALEASIGQGIPAMVHADRRVIDECGRQIAASYWRSRGLGPANFQKLEAHYAFCFAAGATMLINQPLLQLAFPVPEQARMYDTWIELVAHGFGVVDAIDAIALDYRRHGANVSGSSEDNSGASARRPWARAKRLWHNTDHQRSILDGYVAQARAFESIHGKRLDEGARTKLAAFLSLSQRGFLGRAQRLWQSGAAPPGIARTAVFLALSRRLQA